MSKEITFTAARLARDVPAAEIRLDDALIAVSSLMTSIVTARRDTVGVPAAKGHATIQRLMKAQIALVGASGDILRVHGDLADIGQATAGYDLHECPKTARSDAAPLASVA
ncbi:hypothetical protein [Sphingopyxis sp.]|uniref:hypothetical protein n=1 Tax=Sphingopyxis sp. TaxID=1908224 RepID=UPI002D7A06B9|nr:hypothetical protein [Sphingopyxis sp.]HET6523146.1 hypothetical protein [Sphingopyxis sp.]